MKESARAAQHEIAHNRCIAALRELPGAQPEKIQELEDLKARRMPPAVAAMEEQKIMADILEGLSSGGAQEDELLSVDGIGEETAAELRERGIESRGDLKAASDEDLLAVPGIGQGTLKKIRKDLA